MKKAIQPRCKVCGKTRPEVDFYAKVNRLCKEHVKAAARAWRNENIERARANDRKRRTLPHRMAAKSEYQKSSRGLATHRNRIIRYREKYPERAAAVRTANNAIRDRRLIRQPCEKCGASKSQAHHDDYSKPLEVRWLCVSCHAGHHLRERMLRMSMEQPK